MATDGLVAALARAQLAFPPITKTHTNPAFKGSQYADVADVLAAVRPVLAAEGIVVTQSTVVKDEGVILVTALLLGNDNIVSHFPLPVQGLTAPQVGSLLTYHRRYQLCAILGVHPVGDDDDGNLAAQAAPASTYRDRPAEPLLKGDPYAAAASSPPEKPLAEMTAGEMARYGESIGVRVTGSKADILRQLETYVLAASGAEPFDLPDSATLEDGAVKPAGAATTVSPRPDPADIPFNPTVFDNSEARQSADAALKRMRPDARASVRKGTE